jgi:mono/diheme cytochrome c family protein
MAGDERPVGGRIYMDSCAACHRLSGSGENFAFPTLAGNSGVLNSDPSSLIAVILNGARLPSTDAAPTGLATPPFGWRYDDAEIAALATFVRANWVIPRRLLRAPKSQSFESSHPTECG